MGRLKRKLIPTQDLNARKFFQAVDDFNYPVENDIEFTLEDCSVHAIQGYSQTVERQGLSDEKTFKIIAPIDVEIIPRIEGNDVRYQIQVNGYWCDVVDVDPWNVGLRPHQSITVVHRNER